MAKSSSTEHRFTSHPPAFADKAYVINDTIAAILTPDGVYAAVCNSPYACLMAQGMRHIPGLYSFVVYQEGEDTVFKATVAFSEDDTERQRISGTFQKCTIPSHFDSALHFAPKKMHKEIKEQIASELLQGGSVQVIGVVTKVEVVKAKGPNGTKGFSKPRLPADHPRKAKPRRYAGLRVGA